MGKVHLLSQVSLTLINFVQARVFRYMHWVNLRSKQGSFLCLLGSVPRQLSNAIQRTCSWNQICSLTLQTMLHNIVITISKDIHFEPLVNRVQGGQIKNSKFKKCFSKSANRKDLFSKIRNKSEGASFLQTNIYHAKILASTTLPDLCSLIFLNPTEEKILSLLRFRYYLAPFSAPTSSGHHRI